MNNKQLTTINQNAKSALIKSKNLLDITKKILDKGLVKSFEFKPFLIEKVDISFTNFVNSVAISPDGKYIVSGSAKTIKIWDMKTGECLKTLMGHSDFINSVAISSDGKYIISGSHDKTIKIWDIKTGECLKTLVSGYLFVMSVAISPDGKYIISGSLDNTIKIWDIKTGECLKTLKGHSSSVDSVAISINEKYIVSGSWDETIKIWNIKTGENIYTIDSSYNISIDNNGFFKANDKDIDKYLRVSEEPLTQRKLTLEEINHFRKKDDFLDVNERTKIEC